MPVPGRVAPARVRAQDAQLFARYCADRDRGVRDALVRRYLPLARTLARRYATTGEPFDDLMQVASLGLLRAIDRFDPARGSAFTSFAVPIILGELRRHFRDRCWSVRVPRGLQELSQRLDLVGTELTAELGRPPSPDELAAHAGAPLERVLDALQAGTAHYTVSLDSGRRGRDEDDDGLELGVEDRAYARVENDAAFADLLSVLSERERLVLRLRFAHDLTQSEIGRRIGVSQVQVSRIIRSALAQLQTAVGRAPTAARSSPPTTKPMRSRAAVPHVADEQDVRFERRQSLPRPHGDV
jgi:RNA polymerase sigma-B factor